MFAFSKEQCLTDPITLACRVVLGTLLGPSNLARLFIYNFLLPLELAGGVCESTESQLLLTGLSWLIGCLLAASHVYIFLLWQDWKK